MRIPAEKAAHLHVPQYDHLRIEDLLGFAAECNHGAALKYLPRDQLDIDRLPRQYVINVIYTLCGEDFEKWISKTIESRNDQLLKQRDLLIEMDPAIAKIFKESTSVSRKYPSSCLLFLTLTLIYTIIVSKGISSHLLKPNCKRRRTKKQVQEDKLKAKILQEEIESKVASYDLMKNKVDVAEV